MLTTEQNRLLTQTDAGTPMGRLVRQHWVPFAREAEIPGADEPPERIRLLGENLVMFRDSEGRPALFDELCPHRRASLFFGRNEDCGIRCVYHGWKFDVTGQCVDMPSEPPASRMKENVRARAYPVRIGAGLAWAYLGDDAPPELPAFEWMAVPATQRHASRWVQDCNFVQAMEGELDEAHVSFLHRRLDAPAVAKDSLVGGYFVEDTAPRWSVLDTPVGIACGARRTVDDGARYLWRINQFAAPFYTLIAPSDDPHSRVFRAWVPRDDESCWVICVTWRDDGPVGETELGLWRNGEVAHRRVEEGTTRPTENRRNNYGIDREQQRTISFTGIHGIRSQDAVVTESPGPIVDRSHEHLGSSDLAVVMLRRSMLQAARDVEQDKPTRYARGGAAFSLRSYAGYRASGEDFGKVPEIVSALNLPPAREAIHQ
jgi:nitrite reductase/ring-hydroxylating ferredoxin subunit